MRVTLSQLEKERDFYFTKLRDIEIVCQALESKGIPLVGYIERIMYATQEEDTKKAMADAEAHYGVSTTSPAPTAEAGDDGEGAAAGQEVQSGEANFSTGAVQAAREPATGPVRS